MDNQRAAGLPLANAQALPIVPPANLANAQANAAAIPIVQPVNQVNRIQAKVPPFWKLNPQLWFKQIEAQFSNSGIVNDLTKYNTIVGVYSHKKSFD